MRKMEVATRCMTDEVGEERQFHYALIIDMEEGINFAFENYGVAVGEQGGEEVVIRGITLRAERIDELLTMLVEGMVSPTVTRDVVEDWM